MASFHSSVASCVRTMSPHRCKLLSQISQGCGLQPSRLTRPFPHSSVDHESATVFCTSCHHCHSATSQSVAGQVNTPSEKSQGTHMPSRLKNNVGSLLSGLGNFAANLPSRVAEEINRFSWHSDKTRVAATSGEIKVKVMKPLYEEMQPSIKDSIRKTAVLKNVDSPSKVPLQEQHSFAEAMQDTHSSVVSYYTSSASSDEVKPSKTNQNAVITTQDKKPSKDEEHSWNVFRQFNIPLPFLEIGSGQEAKKKPLIKTNTVSRPALEMRTRALVTAIKTASSVPSQLKRLEDLCKHLINYPSMRTLATHEKVLPFILRMTGAKSKLLRDQAYETLALLGYVFPVKGSGIRILSLDGGGTRGLIMLECLAKIEQVSGKHIYQLFDYVCGVSTGALIAAITCLYRLPLEECRRLYLEFSRQMFNRSRVIGTSGLVWNHAFYSTDQWEKILQEEMGHKLMVEFAQDPLVPKMAAVSNIMNTPRMVNFLFRNYNHPPDTYSQFPGSCTNSLWEVIRASSAAPGYYEPFILGEYVHMDGGLMTNNPTALAIHESRLLWPNECVQCVVSLGTGRYEPTVEMSPTKLSLKEKVSKVVDSATDTEGVHMILTDLMQPSTYFRFNPYLSEEIQLDEIRDDKFKIMQQDAQMYLHKNEHKVQRAVEILKKHRTPQQRLFDWLRHKGDMH